MSRSWSGRPTRRPQEEAAQAAQDAAVAAFLDLDGRQSYVTDAVSAADEGSAKPAGGSTLDRAWDPIEQRCFQASAEYLAVAESHSLHDAADRPTGVDPAAAAAAFTRVQQALADASVAVDTFYRAHSAELERAVALRAATPTIAKEARQAAEVAEAALAKAEHDGFGYPSVLAAADQLVGALTALRTAEAANHSFEIRQAAAAVTNAATAVGTRIATARSLPSTVHGTLSSVRTRIEAVTNRLEALPATRSALLREFSAACSADLAGADDRARRSLDAARQHWASARAAIESGRPEAAAADLTTARSLLTDAAADGDAMSHRLEILRSTRADPAGAAAATRFKVRDAQLLVVDRGLIREWGTVLDAQADRIERAAAALHGPHPDYWSYLQTLHSVEDFVKNVVNRVRGRAHQ